MLAKILTYEWTRTAKVLLAYALGLFVLTGVSRLGLSIGSFGLAMNDLLLTFLAFLPGAVYLAYWYYRAFHSSEALFTFSWPTSTGGILTGKLLFVISFILLYSVISYGSYLILGDRLGGALVHQSLVTRLMLIGSMSLAVWTMTSPLLAIISLVHMGRFQKRPILFGLIFFILYKAIEHFLVQTIDQRGWLQQSIRFTTDGGYRLAPTASPLLDIDSGLRITLSQLPQSLILSGVSILFIAYYFNKRLIVEAS